MSLVRPGIGVPVWRKARRSLNNGDCVEVGPADSYVFVRDSKNPGGAALGYSTDAWRSFLVSAKQGKFDELRLLVLVSQGLSGSPLYRLWSKRQVRGRPLHISHNRP
jgi:hypothetical protein